MIQTLHLTISGSVQGVGYRQWIKHKARQMGIVGWVKNRPDGAVESVMQGEKDSVASLVQRAWKGPFLANVSTIEIKEIPHQEHIADFVVIQ